MRWFVLIIWDFFDPLYFKFSRLFALPDSNDEKNIFRVRLTCYKGNPVVLSDGTEINKNDLLVKIHLYNIKILMDQSKIKNEYRKAKALYHQVTQSLPGIEQFIRTHEKSADIKGIIGITRLRGYDKLGFELADISSTVYRTFKYLSSFPIFLLSGSQSSAVPSYLFMSKNELSNRYKDN